MAYMFFLVQNRREVPQSNSLKLLIIKWTPPPKGERSPGLIADKGVLGGGKPINVNPEESLACI